MVKNIQLQLHSFISGNLSSSSLTCTRSLQTQKNQALFPSECQTPHQTKQIPLKCVLKSFKFQTYSFISGNLSSSSLTRARLPLRQASCMDGPVKSCRSLILSSSFCFRSDASTASRPAWGAKWSLHSLEDGIYGFRKAHTHSTLSQKVPQCCLWKSSISKTPSYSQKQWNLWSETTLTRDHPSFKTTSFEPFSQHKYGRPPSWKSTPVTDHSSF